MRLVDAHTHIRLEEHATAIALASQGLWQLVTATQPNQAEQVATLARADKHIIPTYGLHPWYAADFAADSMDNWLRTAPIIGEIGLDTVWTTTPLDVQRAALSHQLQLATELGKTVVLHTKGAEAEIVSWLEQFTPAQTIVHWYSGPAELLPRYISLGCYFTLGPDIAANQAVQDVCSRVPTSRLLTETDGPGAASWATGKQCSLLDAPEVLNETLQVAARIRGIKPGQMQELVYENLQQVLAEANRCARQP